MTIKYVLFDKDDMPWSMIYCNSNRSGIGMTEDIARSIVSYKYYGLLSSKKAEILCMNSDKGITNINTVAIMKHNDVYYLWRIGDKVHDMEWVNVPHLFYVREIGMIVNDKEDDNVRLMLENI